MNHDFFYEWFIFYGVFMNLSSALTPPERHCYNRNVKYKLFADLLLIKMHEFEIEQGRRITVSEFAEYLGSNQSIMSIWMKGDTKPSDANIDMLAVKLGDEIYDIFGKTRPDPRLKSITSRWDRIPEDKQLKLAEDAARYELEGQESNERKKIPKPARSGANT